MYRKKNNETIFIAEKDSIERKDESGPISRYFRKRKFQKRVAEYEKHEVKAAVKQCLQKMENIKAEAETRTSLIKEMVFPKMEFSYHTGEEHSLRNKYGEQLINSLVDGVICGEPIPAYLTKYYALEYERLKPRDPLINWFIPSAEHTYELISRIQEFAAYIARQVKFSLLIEPGHFRAHLSAFSEQFNDLQCFFDCVELTPEEVSQRAFDANRLSKARNQKVECIDHSRVILHRAEEILNKIAGSNVNSNFLKPSDIFGDLDIPQFHPYDTYGTDDFIHANYVAGGPLANKFICTQAPMKNTMNDFWRMVYQEQPSYIFMLCDAVDIANQGAMGTEEVDHCPVYWPKIPGSSIDYGAIVVKNVGVDGITDPLFTITKLEIFYSTAPSHVIMVEHYRWDWQDYHDIHWPLRLLQKSRQSMSRPTIVHCVDGCGKTGTLVYIEVLLMQLLRGTENYEHPLLTCAVFVRLQRRYAIENYMQYLYDVPKRLHGIKAASGAGHPPIGALHAFITGQEGYAMFMKNERTFEGEKKNRHGPQIKIDPRQSCDPGIFLFLYLCRFANDNVNVGAHFPQLPHPVLALDCGIIANADGLADTSDLWILYRGPENFDFSGTIEQYGIVPQHSQRFHVNQLRQLLMQVQLFQDVGETAKADSITSASRLMFVHEIENFFH